MTDSQTIDNTHWQRAFFTFWTGQAFSLFGSSLVQFALIWWITQSTGSATLLATATLVGMLPQIVLGPFAGALVDRWKRKAVMIVADSSIALVSLALAGLFFTGRAQVWHVFVAMALRSLGGAFHWPAMAASTSLMVPNQHLARIAGMNQALNGVMGIIAPPVGAMALGFLPMGGVLLIDVATAAFAVLALVAVRVPEAAPAPRVSGEGTFSRMLRDVREGLGYVAKWPGLLALCSFAMLLNFLLTPAFSLLPLLVTRHYGGQALLLGELNSAMGLGVVGGGLILSAWGGFHKKIYTSLVGLVLMGAGTIVVGASPAGWVWLAVAGMALAGFANPIANGPLEAIFQASITPGMQGRVFGLISTGTSLISPISLLVAGPISDTVGIQAWYWVAGVSCIGIAAVMLFVPALQNIEEQGRSLRDSAASPVVALAPEDPPSRL
jgi:DHA3 family macrolide efflux protein-like MFS transporter